MDYRQQIEELLKDPNKLMKKKPFYRGGEYSLPIRGKKAYIGEMVTEPLPNIRWNTVPQAQFLMELDPNCHKVLNDDNIPSITQKINGKYTTIQYSRMAIPFQQIIKNKHLLHLCGNKTVFTQLDLNPTKKQQEDFIVFKQYWNERNQDGMRTKMVDAQLSCGDAGLLYYYDRKGRIKSRLMSYADGYILYPHNDENGDRILDCVYYKEDDIEYLDCFDDKYRYRFKRGGEYISEDASGWVRDDAVEHGFSESPLVTKRGEVAWNKVQNVIEVYEVMYNIFLVIQKRHGWGILYVKGKFLDEGKKIAGAIVLNDTSIDGKGSADFKTPPSPDNMIKTLELMEETIQKGSSTTFILPKDINMSGDVSGIALQIAQSFDNEEALRNVIDWQNVIDKCTRLFKEGLSHELVTNGINENAVTDFDELHISAEMKPWRPLNETEYNNMLITLKQSGLISERTGVEKNTESTPDEMERKRKETEEAIERERMKKKEGSDDTTETETLEEII